MYAQVHIICFILVSDYKTIFQQIYTGWESLSFSPSNQCNWNFKSQSYQWMSKTYNTIKYEAVYRNSIIMK